MSGTTLTRHTTSKLLRACVLLLLACAPLNLPAEEARPPATPTMQTPAAGTPETASRTRSLALAPNSTLWDAFLLGGWCMWPILLFCVLGLMFFFERAIELRQRRHSPKGLDKDVVHVVDTRGVDSGLALCLEKQCSLSRVLYSALLRYGTSRQEMEAAIHDESSRLLYDLRRNCRWIAVMAGVAPLCGLLGTVLGLIDCGHAVSALPSGTLQAIAGGVAIALIPLAWGLTVAIPLIVLYQIVRRKAEDIVRDITERSIDSIITLDRKARRSIRLIEDLEEHLETQEMAAAKAAPLLDEEFADSGDKMVKSSVTTPAQLPAMSYQEAVRKSSTHGDVKAVSDPNTQAQKSGSSTENKAR
jgi:biopolymer transport protein ExbB